MEHRAQMGRIPTVVIVDHGLAEPDVKLKGYFDIGPVHGPRTFLS